MNGVNSNAISVTRAALIVVVIVAITGIVAYFGTVESEPKTTVVTITTQVLETSTLSTYTCCYGSTTTTIIGATNGTTYAQATQYLYGSTYNTTIVYTSTITYVTTVTK